MLGFISIFAGTAAARNRYVQWAFVPIKNIKHLSITLLYFTIEI